MREGLAPPASCDGAAIHVDGWDRLIPNAQWFDRCVRPLLTGRTTTPVTFNLEGLARLLAVFSEAHVRPKLPLR